MVDLTASERQVLDIIWRRGPIARGDLATATGLTGATITRVIQSVSRTKLITDTVLRDGMRGQPVRPLQIVPHAAYSIGVYFSHHHAEIGLVDLGGTIHAIARHQILEADVESISKLTRDFVDKVVGDGLVPKGQLVGIGLALPGDFIGGPRRLNAHAFFPKLRDRDLYAEFQARSSYKVFIENDAASAALGERALGSGHDIDSFIFVHVGHGIGGGIILNGKLYRGTNGNAGMVGIQFPNDKPRPSGQDLFAHLQQHNFEINDFNELDRLQVHGCPPLKSWIRRAGMQLRQQLSITARLIDPSAIIIGGRIPSAIAQGLTAEIDGPGFCDEGQGFSKPRVLASTLGPMAGLVGAACVPFVDTFFATKEAGAIAPQLAINASLQRI